MENINFLLPSITTALAVSTVCAYLGIFVIMKRIVFISISLSQIAALGVVIGIILGLEPTSTSVILTSLAMIIFWFMFRKNNKSRESIVGLIYAFSLSLATILISKNPIIESHGIDVISGNILYSTTKDMVFAIIYGLAILLIHYLLFKEFIFISFDRETATASGLNTELLDFILYLTIGFTISVMTKLTGVIFVFSSLIIPPLCAISVSKSVKNIVITSIFIAIITTIFGTILSYKFDLPTSPTIVTLYCLIFLITKIV